MKTGEGKTLVATLPAYLNALPGRRAYSHRKRIPCKARFGGKRQVYDFLGLTTGLIIHNQNRDERKHTPAHNLRHNNEMGFDYLRDNMAIYKEQVTQRAIIMRLWTRSTHPH